MSNVHEGPSQNLDDAFVYTSSGNSEFTKVLSNLFTKFPAGKWKEVKAKFNTTNELEILVETALELSSSGSGAALFRKRGDADETLIGIWYSRVIKHAKKKILLSAASKIRAITPGDLRSIAQLSIEPQNINQIAEILFENFGIILVIERGFSGMKLDGIASILPTGQTLIALSLRYPRYDYFWFTLIHELSHVCLHQDILQDSVIYDDLEEENMLDIEIEANRMAADSIIPRYIFNKSEALRNQDEESVLKLAQQASIHPALAAGAIQHHKKDFKIFSKITNSLNVRELLGVE